MTKEDKFEENLLSLLTKKKFDTVVDKLSSPEKEAFVSENVWNLISLVCETVKKENLLKNDADVTSCQKILHLLVDKGNPKEILLALLEQADSFKDHEFFCLLLSPLRCTLQRTPGKRAKSLQWVLSILNAHIETLQLPQDVDLQGEEKLLLDTDPAVHDATYVLSRYLVFIDFFVKEVSFESLKNKEIHYFDRIYHQQELLHKYILKLFNHPLLYHDLHVLSNSRPKSALQALCRDYIDCLSQICRNVFNLFRYNPMCITKKENSSKTSADEDEVSPLAFANLSYLIFVENVALAFQPFVYSHIFIFMKNLEYITLLLKREENLVLHKGLCLADRLLNQLDDLQLDYDCIELESFRNFPRLLLNVTIFCKIEAHRKAALKAFTTYVSKCNYKGRYHVIMQVLATIKHSGAEGLVISMYKKYFHEALNGTASADYFLGNNFISFVKKVFVLSNGVETDILEYSDRITTALNFLRYLLLRDKKEENSTGIWDLLSFISEKFTTPLTTGLDFSRAHYKQVLSDVEEIKKDMKAINTVVTCNSEILPNVPVGFQKDVYTKALTTFDMIESILARVKELMSE